MYVQAAGTWPLLEFLGSDLVWQDMHLDTEVPAPKIEMHRSSLPLRSWDQKPAERQLCLLAWRAQRKRHFLFSGSLVCPRLCRPEGRSAGELLPEVVIETLPILQNHPCTRIRSVYSHKLNKLVFGRRTGNVNFNQR